MRFPQIGDLPYFVTLGGHGFYWFSIELGERPEDVPRLTLRPGRRWETLLAKPQVRKLEAALPPYIASRRWFASKARTITSVSVVDVVPVPGATRGGVPLAAVVIVQVELDHGSPEQYLLPMAYATGGRAEDLTRWHPEAVIAQVHTSDEDGVLFDAVYEPAFTRSMLDAILRRRRLAGGEGSVVGAPAPMLRQIRERLDLDAQPVLVTAEQSNSSVTFGDGAILKFIRRFETGVNPGVEIGRFLGERAHFPYAPATGGSLEYRTNGPASQAATLASLEAYVPNEGDGWSYVVDALEHRLEEALAHTRAEELHMVPPPRLLHVAPDTLAPGHLLLGPHLEWSSLLGRRTGELHLALTSDRTRPDFAPEPLTAVERQSLYHGARSTTKRVLRQVAHIGGISACVAEVLDREGEIGERLRVMSRVAMQAERIRCHGDYHLGQVLWTGKDFVIIDFEGEPARSLGHRRLKRPAAFDLAGMIRSFHYAGRVAAIRLGRDHTTSIDRGVLEPWLTLWYRWVAGTFLRSYLEVVGHAGFLPSDDEQLSGLLDFFLLEKAVYELGYEANSRPDWIDIPAQGILDILDATP